MYEKAGDYWYRAKNYFSFVVAMPITMFQSTKVDYLIEYATSKTK